tara:strand:- start:581 stop:931 length:351 start_codon:yes stop_codon:yes gene_type:complete
MSLESKIEELIKALNANTEALTASKSAPAKKAAPKKEAVEEAVEAKSEPEQKPAEDKAESVSYKEVQDAVLTFVREDTIKHKPLVRTLLDAFHAKKVSDLDEGRLNIFMKQLKALK